jgi:hypothetical protein
MRPPEELDAEVPDMQCSVGIQLFTLLLRFGSRWFANHALQPGGTPRMFMERGSEFTPVEGKSVSDDFVVATFAGKWKFPRVGSDLMLTVDFALE